MIKDIKELNFPKYATLETASVTIADMGDRTITSQVKIDGDVVPDFSYDWEVEFKGERYIHPVRTPQGTKDNSSLRAKIDLVFQHWAIYEMKRQYFVEMASTTAGTAIADKYIASLGLNLEDFIVAFNLVLNHYFGGRIIINLNPNPLQPYSKEAKFVSISYSYIWDMLQQMHEIYGVRWTLKTNADGVCEILMGYPAEEVSHIFEYGFEGGLLSVQRQVQSTDIRNRLLGRGGSKNLPYRYFKDKDPNNPLFEADPDWIPELANIAFTELLGKTFRDYVRGWKARRYGGTPMAEPTEAYLIGYNAEKFDPIEYVDDKESIEKYGVHVGALKNNEEIYPSIQGAPGDVDMIVDAEQVTDDDVDAAVENDSVTTNLESGHQTYRNAPANSTITIETLTKHYFSIPADKVGNLDMSLTVTGKYSNFGDYEETYPILKADTVKITIYDRNTDAIITSSTVPVINIPAGDYYYMILADVETNYDKTSMVTLNIESVHLITSTPDKPEGWTPTFDIWIRNIWGSERNDGETDQQYADRVWLPILGDRMGDEARVVFASGWLSFSSDWEFPIVGYAFDDSKPNSHWRLTLEKIDAERDAGRPFIPYEGYNAAAGDRFFFIGIDMPWQYVYWGEERVDDYKSDRLPETARINPSWVIKTDKVRLNQNREGAKLIDSLSAGAQIRLASKQFISGAYESLYVQSLTYNWTADTILYPDVEVVVSDKVHTVKNPVAQMQGNIETLQRQMGSLSNIQQIIRQVCDQLYLRKDGVEDLSKSPTRFLGKVTGEKFRQGQIGGRDWGIYRDKEGKSIAEFDKLIIRDILSVAELETNHITHMGGTRVMSKAEMECIAVEETTDGYICYFDQKQGTKENLFAVDDIVWSQSFDAEDVTAKYYKSVISAIGDNYIKLAKNRYDGDMVPSVGDVIVQAGNTSDEERQAIIVIEASGNPSITLYRGVNSFVFPDPETRIQSGNNLFTGRVHMEAGSTIPEEALGDLSNTITNAIGGLEFGKYNLLRNSGFTGDFLSESLEKNDVLSENKQMFSDPFTHWMHENAAVQDSEVSESGKMCVITSGAISQQLETKLIMGESYVLSFRAMGSSLTYSVGGVSKTIALTGTWTRYVEKFTAASESVGFAISDADCAICEIQLERGNVVSAWGHNMRDNQSELAKYQSMQYLEAAIKNGNTDILGGLILSNLIMLGNPGASDNNAGISGIRNDDNDVAFWGGGTFAQAINTVMKYLEDPTYQPTEAEVANMAKVVITHGGRAILNDIILRGIMYAKGGKIGNLEITEDGLRIDTSADGLMHLDEGGLRVTDGKTSQGTLASAKIGSDCGYSAIEAVVGISGMACLATEDRKPAAFLARAIGNHYAFYSMSGQFGGLRTKTRVVTSDAHLGISDFNVLVNKTSGTVTLTMPDVPSYGWPVDPAEIDGQEIIVETRGANVTLVSNGANMYSHKDNNTTLQSEFNVTARGVFRMKYYHEAGMWTFAWIDRYAD